MRPPRGFMLIEMLSVLILLTAFGLVAARLFSWSMRVVREAPEAEQQIHRIDSMLESLRRDVWSASRVEVLDDRALQLTSLNPQAASRWQVEEDGTVVRTSAADSARRAWPQIGKNMRFEPYDGAVLVVHEARGQQDARILLASAMDLLSTVDR